MRIPLLFLAILFTLTACEDDDGNQFSSRIRVVNNSNLDLTNVRLDPSFDNPGPAFGTLGIGETSSYRAYPTGDACSFQLTANTLVSGNCVTTGARPCAVPEPLLPGETYTLTLLPEEVVPAQCSFLPGNIERD